MKENKRPIELLNELLDLVASNESEEKIDELLDKLGMPELK